MAARVQSSTGSGNSGALSLPVTAGDRIVASLYYILGAITTGPNATPTSTTNGVSDGNIWLNPGSPNGFATFGTVFTEQWNAIAKVSGTLVLTYTVPGGVTYYEWQLQEFSGSSGAIDVAASGSGSQGTPTSPVGPVTPTAAGLAVASYFNQGVQTTLPPWTLDPNTNSNIYNEYAPAVAGTPIEAESISTSSGTAAIVMVVYKNGAAAHPGSVIFDSMNQ